MNYEIQYKSNKTSWRHNNRERQIINAAPFLSSQRFTFVSSNLLLLRKEDPTNERQQVPRLNFARLPLRATIAASAPGPDMRPAGQGTAPARGGAQERWRAPARPPSLAQSLRTQRRTAAAGAHHATRRGATPTRRHSCVRLVPAR